MVTLQACRSAKTMSWNCCKGGGEETVERSQKTEGQTLKDKFPRLFRLMQRIRENGAPSKLKLQLRRRRRRKNTVRSQDIPASVDPKDNTDKAENTDTVERKTGDENRPIEDEYDDDDDIICGTIRKINVLPAPNSEISEGRKSTSSSSGSDSRSSCVSRYSTSSQKTCSPVSTWRSQSSTGSDRVRSISNSHSDTSAFMTDDVVEEKTADESGPMEDEYDDDDDIICGTIRKINVLPAPNSRASDETNSTSSSPRSDSRSFCVSRYSSCSLPTCSSVSTWPQSSSVSDGEKPLHSSVTSPFMTATQLGSVDGVVDYVLETSLANSVSPTFPPLTKSQLDNVSDVRDYVVERPLTKSVSPSFPLLTESQLETVNDVTDYVLDKAICASSCESIADLVHGVSIPQRATGLVQRQNGPESEDNNQVKVAEGTGDVPDVHTVAKICREEDQHPRKGTISTHSTARRRRRKTLG